MSPRREDMPPLRREGLAGDPMVQFAEWFARANQDVPLAEAMTLATVDADGAPDARMVLLKCHAPDGFQFFTNYESAKGLQLEASARAALVIYWRELDRQVRARGAVTRLPATESDAYFATRPLDSRLGAWASPQSEPVADRAELERRLAKVSERFSGGEVGRPPAWGGYLLEPESVEFWQGRPGRLHDRFRYMRSGGGWVIERLAP